MPKHSLPSSAKGDVGAPQSGRLEGGGTPESGTGEWWSSYQ